MRERERERAHHPTSHPIFALFRSGWENDVTDSPVRAMNTCNFLHRATYQRDIRMDYRVPVRRKCNVYGSFKTI